MPVVFLVLFLVTFVFDTRLGFLFLGLALVMLYRGAPAKRMKAAGREPAPPPQSAWNDPWGTGGSGGQG